MNGSQDSALNHKLLIIFDFLEVQAIIVFCFVGSWELPEGDVFIDGIHDVLDAADVIVMPVRDNDVIQRDLLLFQDLFEQPNVFWIVGVATIY
jgi:hypothetical protein